MLNWQRSVEADSRHHTCAHSGPPSAQCRGVCAYPLYILWATMDQWAWEVDGWSIASAPNIGYLFYWFQKIIIVYSGLARLVPPDHWKRQQFGGTSLIWTTHRNCFWDPVKTTHCIMYMTSYSIFELELASCLLKGNLFHEIVKKHISASSLFFLVTCFIIKVHTND